MLEGHVKMKLGVGTRLPSDFKEFAVLAMMVLLWDKSQFLMRR